MAAVLTAAIAIIAFAIRTVFVVHAGAGLVADTGMSFSTLETSACRFLGLNAATPARSFIVLACVGCATAVVGGVVGEHGAKRRRYLDNVEREVIRARKGLR